ncbi:MAG: hypothetical protein DMD81_06000 [Candidatus Rokuibacteriota bacterium]|nr:MAG: hypothetical protein DMD81_06000 [Candidatus Rokubacteria bacterium]
MSGPGPGETFHACIEIDGPTSSAEIKKCIAEIKKILKGCGGRLEQNVAWDPLNPPPDWTEPEPAKAPARRRRSS